MINLDFNTGALRAENKVLCHPRMTSGELANLDALERIGDSNGNQIYRSTTEAYWLEYPIESIAMTFSEGTLIGIQINLFPIDADKGKTASDLLITRHLRMHLQGTEKVKGKSEVLFMFEWGVVSCVYDIKLASPSISIRYK